MASNGPYSIRHLDIFYHVRVRERAWLSSQLMRIFISHNTAKCFDSDGDLIDTRLAYRRAHVQTNRNCSLGHDIRLLLDNDNKTTKRKYCVYNFKALHNDSKWIVFIIKDSNKSTLLKYFKATLFSWFDSVDDIGESEQQISTYSDLFRPFVDNARYSNSFICTTRRKCNLLILCSITSRYVPRGPKTQWSRARRPTFTSIAPFRGYCDADYAKYSP